MKMLIDWLSLTFHGTYRSDVMDLIAPAKDWTERDHGTRGYTRSWSYGSAIISAEGSRGIHLSLSGQALREYEAAHNPVWSKTLYDWGKMGARATRCDIAFDDTEGELSMKTMLRHVRQGALTCRSRKFSIVESGDLDDPTTSNGFTIYLGSRESETFVRIYDKAAKQKVDTPWIRVELELKGDKADACLALYATGEEDIFARVLAGHLQFREAGTATRIERSDIADWWTTFLQSAKALRLSLQKARKTVEEVTTWFCRAMRRTLAIAVHGLGDSLDDLLSLINRGQRDLFPEQIAMIRSDLTLTAPGERDPYRLSLANV